MNVIAAVKAYVTKITEESEPGMKVLMMDKETTSIISMVYSQSEIQQKEVYLLERISDSQTPNSGTPLRYLKCLVFVRPTTENIKSLCYELTRPKYGAYYIYFSNIIAKADIKLLAEHDEQEVVKEVQELYMDYLAVNPYLFSIGLINPIKDLSWDSDALQRSVSGVLSVLLSLKKCPLIRYQANSSLCNKLGSKINDIINKESTLFAFGQSSQALLLILDRRDDPITPLLNQWTYQAMVHELLTINNNRVNLSKIPGIPKELSEVVLSAEQDAFYAKNIFLNYGEIGQNIKQLMDDFQLKAKSHQKIESIADMKNFVDAYPQFKKLSGNVSKHVTVVGELSSMVNKYHLLDVSEIEQEITSQNDHSGHLQNIKKLIENEKVRPLDLVKLVILYTLRYQNHANNETTHLIEMLKKRNIPDHLLVNIIYVSEYSSSISSQNDLYNVQDAVKITKRFFKGLSGVDNVYTQHKPLLQEILEEIVKGKLKENLYPCVGVNTFNNRPQEIIVFMVGGVTYEESLAVHYFNKNHPSFKILLGGTSIHNSNTFLEEVKNAVFNIPKKHSRKLIRHINH
ncbi:hypothetical protein HHI36_020329 [Cryptolaemus montrouzieri]|uniref:Vacuolar protein sorting-associated protein 45 n=1 Tax=Cryptolaemus montrouzieri TaxID=559131 RepID=A0ABD2NAD5_9CUCU